MAHSYDEPVPGLPAFPPGRRLDLPGRGTTFVREIPGPPDAADRPVLFLLHGWTVSADLNWFTSYAALGERYRVIAMDHRGHGRGIRSRRRFRLADCADDVAAVCEQLRVESIVPVGYSMGGPISLLTWHRHRDLVDGLVLCATSPVFSAGGPETTFFSMLPLLANAGRLTPRVVRQRVASRLLGTRMDDSPVGQWARREISRSDPVAVADAGASLGRFDALPWLHEIDVPTMVVRTRYDNAVPPARQTLLARGIPGAGVIDVDADHSGCVTAWERFVPALCTAADHVTLAAGRRVPTA